MTTELFEIGVTRSPFAQWKHDHEKEISEVYDFGPDWRDIESETGEPLHRWCVITYNHRKYWGATEEDYCRLLALEYKLPLWETLPGKP